MRTPRALALAAALALWDAGGQAADTGGPHSLSETGAALGSLATDGSAGDLRLTVALGGDSPESTHVWAILGGAERRQRTRDGYWVPWDGDLDSLAENGFEADGGLIEFKLLDEDFAAENHGITLAVGYRAAGVLKYGLFGLLPQPAGQ